MIRYGKSTQYAIAAMSRLAEVHNQETRLSSGDIAKARNLPKSLIAKQLTRLSHAGLVLGSPGPRGGYVLARPPAEICLYDVVVVFERIEDRLACPCGPNWCGHKNPCPLHDSLVELDADFESFLKTTTFNIFCPTDSNPNQNIG